MMLLSEILRMCPDGACGGGLSAHLVSEVLGIRVKLIDPTDAMVKKKQDAGAMSKGTGRKGSTFDDQRKSRHFVPYGGELCEWFLPGSNGKAGIFREEVVVAYVKCSDPVTEPGLVEVGEIGKDMTVTGLNHFASVMRTQASSRPFPLHLCSPSRCSKLVRLAYEVSISLFARMGAQKYIGVGCVM